MLVVATEGVTELLVKSEIFQNIRSFVIRIPIFGEAIKCGYCASVWVAAIPATLLLLAETPLDSYFDVFPNFLWWAKVIIILVFFHRASNYLHNFNDKWLDKYYSKKD